jgi:23S rRNA pseudoU1915 N3-methylase RlmH
MEHLDYSETEFDFIPVEDNPNLKEMKKTVLSENYDEFLKKYPSSVRKVLKENGKDLEKDTLCLFVARHNQEKARKLLFKLLEQKIERWWD